MNRSRYIFLIATILINLSMPSLSHSDSDAATTASVLINEVVTDPQTDWSTNNFNGQPGSGSITESDEYVEIYNASGQTLNLTGWYLVFTDSARTEVKIDASLEMMIKRQFADLPEIYKREIPFGKEIYEIAPAPNCPSGVKGRVAVMEVLEIDKEMDQIILKNPTEPEIWKYARSKGMLTMKDDALIKVFEKVIPFEEFNTL